MRRAGESVEKIAAELGNAQFLAGRYHTAPSASLVQTLMQTALRYWLIADC